MRSILIVEDDADLRALYKQEFTNSGYKVQDAIDPNEAIELLKNNTYDIILSDLLFPSMDGEDIIKSVKSGTTKNTNVPIIVLTNVTDDKKIKKVMELGATRCIFKAQNTPKSILDEVEAVLGNKENSSKNQQ